MRSPVIAVFTLALWSLHAHATEPDRETEGRRAFDAGVTLLQDPDGAKYDEAIVQFRRAFGLVGSWKILGNLGLCALKLERDGEAIEAYEKYLFAGKDGIDPQERAQVARDLATLKVQAVNVHLEFPSPGAVVFDQRDGRANRVANKYETAGTTLDLKLHPGEHHLKARTGNAEASWDVSLLAGSTASHKFDFASVQTVTPHDPNKGAELKSRGPGAAGYVFAGAGVVGLAIGTFFGLEAAAEKSKRDEICRGGLCAVDEGVEHDRLARRDATISTIAFGAGIVSAGIGAWLLLSPRSTGRDSGVWLAPRVASHRAEVQLGGAW